MEYAAYLAFTLGMGGMAVVMASIGVKDLRKGDRYSATMAGLAAVCLLVASAAPMKLYRHVHSSGMILEKEKWTCSVALRDRKGRLECREYRRR